MSKGNPKGAYYKFFTKITDYGQNTFVKKCFSLNCFFSNIHLSLLHNNLNTRNSEKLSSVVCCLGLYMVNNIHHYILVLNGDNEISTLTLS